MTIEMPSEPARLSDDDFDVVAYLKGLTDPEWQAHLDALTIFALRLERRLRWNTPTGRPETRTVEDFVADSIAGLCFNPWKWKPHRQRHRTLEARLRAFLKMDLHGNMTGAAGGSGNAVRIADGDPVLGRTTERGRSPEQEVMDRERRELLTRMRATEKDKRLFDFHFVEGRMPGEIARILGIRVGLVNSRLGEMRKRLRRRFRDEYDEWFGTEGTE